MQVMHVTKAKGTEEAIKVVKQTVKGSGLGTYKRMRREKETDLRRPTMLDTGKREVQWIQWSCIPSWL